MAENPEFQCGFAMAGAISAGAYSAGVVDFVMEALEAYDKAKLRPDWQGPTHDVRIPVMAGASAGGMTAAIAALHAFHDIEHVWPGRPVPAKSANRLYSSWVTDISIERLLETTDLDRGGDKNGVKSALCCSVLEDIVNDVVNMSSQIRQPNWIGSGNDRTLRVLLTLTNLRGVPYSFSVFGASALEQFGMLNHGDYLDFSIALDRPATAGSHPLGIRSPLAAEQDLFKAAALATGAFPIGLAPRLLSRAGNDYETAVRVGVDSLDRGFRPIGPSAVFDRQSQYSFLSVDGGTIDNQPLELARRYLAGGGRNERNGERANKAVILVAPFPNRAHMPDADANDRLVHILPQLLSTLIDQARFKPDELALAESDAVFSRFIISPIRPAANNPAAVRYPIASGSLGGFGGFLHQSFRRHDYLLGRRNAQAFLRWYFALPETNPLFVGFRGDRDPWHVRDPSAQTGTLGPNEDRRLRKKQFAKTVDHQADTFGLPIIPLTEALCQPIEIEPVDLPRPNEIPIEQLEQRINERAGAVVKALVDIDLASVTQDSWIGPVLRLGARQYGTTLASKKAMEFIMEAISDVKAAFAP
ncbi:patatin-like phospholipase family protein [Bradyrhizobium genosp. A]|uniref:patatin-like phospholipase family protein n=1 Tax=Bradyrhizobium genosp. A TaxID=83626 RepID=UPI003CF7490F